MQVDAAMRNAERVAKLRQSGMFRILNVDTWDHFEGSPSDFDTEEDALMYIWLDRQMHQREGRANDRKGFLALWHQCLQLDRGEMARGMREAYGDEDKKLHALDIEPGITLDELKMRLSKPHTSVTSSVSYLYSPDGAFIGEYPI